MPNEASFCRIFSAVAVRPSRSMGPMALTSPVRMLIGGGVKLFRPPCSVKPAPALSWSSFLSSLRAPPRGGGRGSTMVGAMGSASAGALESGAGGVDVAPASGFFLLPGSEAGGPGSRGSCGASESIPNLSAASFPLGSSVMRTSGSASNGSAPSSSSPAPAARTREIAPAAPLTARAPPAKPSRPAANAARSAHRSVATTSAAAPMAPISTAAPQVDSAARAPPAQQPAGSVALQPRAHPEMHERDQRQTEQDPGGAARERDPRPAGDQGHRDRQEEKGGRVSADPGHFEERARHGVSDRA